jgi:lysosomal alpha-mannosidase
MGFKNMVLVRIDYKEKAIMKKNREMEFIWKPFYDLDKGATSIFTHVMYDHYNANNVFPGYVDDVFLHKTDEEIYLEVSKIINWARKERSAYLTNNVLLLFGDDFTHMQPYNNFLNIERIIDYFNNHTVYSNQVKFVYSTPSKYFNQVKSYPATFPEYKNFDFFPYADNPFAYWTGFFTSRPYLKGLVRDAGRYLYSSSRLLFEQTLKDIQINSFKFSG